MSPCRMTATYPLRFQLVGTLAAILVAALLASIYWNGLHGGFFFDDEPNILQPEGLRLERISTDAIRDALDTGLSGPSGRPVSVLSFALNHYFSGFDPFAFKATNLAIHAANGFLVFFLALTLVRQASRGTAGHGPTLASGALALVWLLHPIQATTVLYVVQRMTSLSAFFLFAAMLAHVRAREQGSRAGAAGLVLAWGILWPLSFLSKETGALFPLFVLAYELILRRSARGGLDRFARILAAVAIIGAGAAAAYALSPAGRWLWAGYDFRPFSLAERLLTEGRVLWFYLGLILFPRLEDLGLYHDDIAISTGLFAPWTTLPALAGLAGLTGIAWWARRRAPLLSFGIAWFLIGHALESTVLPLEIAHEHRNYVPLFGVLLPAAWALTRAVEQPGPRRTLGIALLLAALAYPAFITALRSHQFGSEGRRTQIEAQHHPDSARTHYEAGRAMAQTEASADPNSPAHFIARTHFEKAGKLDPGFKLGLLGLLHLRCLAGKEAETAQIEELARRMEATPFGPGDRTMMYSLKEMAISGTLCLERADIERLFAAARANPTASPHVRAMLHSWLADYLTLRARDLPAARAELERSLAIAPYNPSNRLKLAQLAYLQGQRGDALRMLDELRNAPLTLAEKETLSGLRACLEGRDPSVKCIGR